MSLISLIGHLFIGILCGLIAVTPGRMRIGPALHKRGDPSMELRRWQDVVLRVGLLALASMAWWEVWLAYFG